MFLPTKNNFLLFGFIAVFLSSSSIVISEQVEISKANTVPKEDAVLSNDSDEVVVDELSARIGGGSLITEQERKKFFKVDSWMQEIFSDFDSFNGDLVDLYACKERSQKQGFVMPESAVDANFRLIKSRVGFSTRNDSDLDDFLEKEKGFRSSDVKKYLSLRNTAAMVRSELSSLKDSQSDDDGNKNQGISNEIDRITKKINSETTITHYN